MKRFFDEFSVMMSKRRHLLFLIIVWSIFAITLFAFGKGLDSTTESSFGKNTEGLTEYAYELEAKNDKNVINADALTMRMKLNKLLSENPDFDYYSYYKTTGTVTELVNKGLDISDKKDNQQTDNETARNHLIQVMFLDKGAAKRGGFADLFMQCFEGDLDYDAKIPTMVGYGWQAEKISAAEGGYPVSVQFAEFRISCKGIIYDESSRAGEENDAAAIINLGGKNYNLHNYVVIPLRDLGSANSTNPTANDQARRAYWCKIYDLRNNGRIISDLTPDSLQKKIDELLVKEGLSDSFVIHIKGAHYTNKLLFSDKLETMRTTVRKVSKVSLVLALLMLVAYMVFSVSKNQRYEFLMYINGTGKIEMWIINLMQIVIWMFFTVALSYGLYFGIVKILNIDYVKLPVFIKPAAIIAVVALVAHTIRLAFWDAGRMIRKGKGIQA